MSRINRVSAAAALVALLGMSGLARSAAAQVTATASISAIADVQGRAPLNAVGALNLNFHTVIAGNVGTPPNLGADAGRFDITGEPSTPVNLSFTLPTVLSGPGGTTIPISFNSTDGLLWSAWPNTFTTFNPNTVTHPTLTGVGTLTIGISGTVSPPTGTTTGQYTGTITLTVAY